ncbi:MAG: hypothetical protein WBX95_07070, partial [Xanthobacteraceae bacterium]
PCWKGLSADSEEKRVLASDLETVLVDSLKALDPNRPIREADMMPTYSLIILDVYVELLFHPAKPNGKETA